MTATHDGRSDGHGPKFMGVYARLLEPYMRLDLEALGRSLREAGIAFDLEAEPAFVDP